MNFKKMVAAIAATAVASSAFVFSTSALVTKIDTIKLNSGSDTDKLVQYDMSAFGVDAIDTMTLVGIASVGDGWIGGGGAVGFDSVDGWLQIDFALDSEGVTVNDTTGEMTAVIDFTTLGKDTTINFEKEDALCQIGWWWGSGDGTLDLSDIQVNGKSIIGNEAVASEEDAADEDDAAEEDAADEEEAVEEDAAEEDAAPAEDPNALPFNLSAGQYTYDFILNGTDYANTKTITFTLETASDGDFGGGVMFNGTACGWSQSEENFYSGPEGDKDLKCVKLGDCLYELTVAIPDGIFGEATDDDFYAQVVVQKWWGDDPITITAVELDKAASAPVEEVVVIAPAPEAGEVDAAVESSKGSPDTGVADVAVVAGLALVAGAAIVVAKKRK